MFRDQSLLTRLIWLALIFAAAEALITWRLSLAFIALATLALSLVPVLIARWAEIRVPPSFMLAVVAFVGGTIFLGEVFDFYYRFWWWDIAMHGGSAIGFGLIGFVLVFMMFQGDRFAAPPSAIAFFAYCFALAIGAMWEVFEFAMDQSFGFNMQKSGLRDTMSDLIVDMAGALVGAGVGYAYLRGRALGGLTGMIDEFVARNPRFFRKRRK
ncbi:hypothetical protein OB2597_04223 [Pseudooceanicola batsensis HTCC2597]|uniref:Membrane protein YjdF n=1 Tax=Pseudooceanicola batsensis (strain ATCC BAA-863 / DSM 15984 / KCTC 12145 / HTCC2597) TaxID=252305 RepID=A3U2P1_PSEBH|nr:hypothetical protein [Pseudooceanicola batsensis]EAQ01615.1 hypothetical protein OB2597_04223 [Pseudooceanicola batsensis HTCC2597]